MAPKTGQIFRKIRRRYATALAVVTTLLVLFAVRHFAASPPSYDLLITGGHIIDGTGNPWFKGSVAVKDGRIADVGRLRNARARRVIDATGMVVAPGFIDLHSHSDYTLLVDGYAQSKIRQGVTTEILGENESAGPVENAAISALEHDLAKYRLKRDWTTLAGYFARVKRQGISVNIASYVGSGQVRLCVMGDVKRAPTPEELKKMEGLVAQAMRQGAIGLSSGLIYSPNMFAKTDELIALAKVAARYGGIYATHLRSEGNGSLVALDEAIEIGKEAGLPVQIFHFKIAGKDNWGKMPLLIHRINAAREQGIDVTADQYPYTAAMTDLHMCLPPRYREGTSQQITARLKDPEVRAAIRRDIVNGLPGWQENEVQETGGWHGVMVSSVQNPQDKKFQGKRMDEVARMMGKDPVDALCDLLIAEGGSAWAIYFSMSEPDVRLAMRQPWVGVGSDGMAVNPDMRFAQAPHPRFYGTFPRILGHYVREEKVLTLPQAIRKMTSLAAQVTGLHDRGLLKPSMAADITIFNPKTVSDRATYQNPLQYPAGINYVIVNGVIVIDQGRHTGAKPGRVLYGPGKSL